MPQHDKGLFKERSPYLIVALVIFVIDQITKYEATHLADSPSLRVIDGFFHLTYVENAGIAWGFFSDAGSLGRVVLGIISVIAVIGITIYALRTPISERLTHAGLTLVLGGVLGNLTDRILRGAVIDFLDFTLGSYRWPTFNVADMAICTGAMLLIVDAMRTPSSSGHVGEPAESISSE